MAADLYAVLGVSRDATAEEIKRSYRKLARELHPDVNPDPATQDRFKEVTAAYEVLSDPDKRQMYDLGGDPRGGPGGAGFGQGFGFGDIMDAFFGAQSRGPRPRTARGKDALIRLQVTLAEATFGVDPRDHGRHRRSPATSAPARARRPARPSSPARCARAAARCSRCSARSSARS